MPSRGVRAEWPDSMSASDSLADPIACFGDCRDCGRLHELPVGNARAHALELMREFEELQRLDYLVGEADADPLLSFSHLFPGGHGNMFGVLECVDANGETVVLRAFSSLRRGIREIDGWVLPILSAQTYFGVIVPAQREIEDMTAALCGLESGSTEHSDLLRERKRASRKLFDEMRSRYRFHNFRGEERVLEDALWPPRAAPGGVGECCAPKLLDHASRNGLRPRGLAEFYWGDNGSKKSGEFYPSCESRCRPILGFLLCGLDA